MSFDFDKVHSRRHTGSVKWDHVFKDGVIVARDNDNPAHDEDALLPLWVADMDFVCPQPVIDAIVERAGHGIFGYTLPMDGFYEAIGRWAQSRYDWRVEREWIALSPGVVPAMNVAVQTYARPGDQILIQGPVYYHFMRAPTNHGIDFVSNDLVYDPQSATYNIDFDDFEAKAGDPRTRVAMLCNPHNPTSRVWTRDELQRLADICIANDVLIVSDEIHCDLIFNDNVFVPIASLSEAIAQNSVTMMAPSKTFNLAGLKTSYTIIPNPELKAQYVKGLLKLGLFGGNTMGILTTEVAYNEGGAWLKAMLDYVWANYEFTRDYFARELPTVQVIEPQGTYLLWVNCGPLGFSPDERKRRIYEQAGVFLDDGSMFGSAGADFERINLACPRATLTKAIERMAAALKQ